MKKIIITIGFILSFGVIAADSPKELPNIFPTIEQQVSSVHVLELLKRYHYNKLPFDENLSQITFDNYLKTLDYNRLIFSSEDVAEFEKYKLNFTELAAKGNLNLAFAIYRIYMLRAKQQIDFMQKQLTLGIDNISFTGNERLETKREEVTRAKNADELFKLWKALLKDEILRLKLAKKSNPEITEILTKRYNNRLKRLTQTKSEDVFNVFINSISRVYDPHTEYLSPDDEESFNINLSLSLTGIGAQLTSDSDYTKIINLIPAGPAEKSKQLAVSDLIIGVGQENKEIVDVIGWRLDDVVKLIRGEKGTKVTLEVIPATNIIGDETSKKVVLIRDEIKLEDQAASKHVFNVNGYKIGVIKIPSFYIDFKSYYAGNENYNSATRDVKKILTDLMQEQVQSVVIDLRDNGGGSLQEASELTSLFIGAKPIVLVKNGRGAIDTILDDSRKSPLYQGPLTVLVNRSSASASEIFAGAMKDYHRALIVGNTTFGKGTVQSIQNLNYGKLKLTTAKFYRVSGDSTQNKGVEPDIHFPSYYNINKIGERALDFAMSWDKIQPVIVNKNNPFTKYLPTLKENHKKRSEQNLEFVYIKKIRELADDLEKNSSVSLNEELRFKEHQILNQRKVELENLKRKAHNVPLITEINNENDEDFVRDNNKIKIDLTKDAYLNESINITIDYLTLANNKLADN